MVLIHQRFPKTQHTLTMEIPTRHYQILRIIAMITTSGHGKLIPATLSSLIQAFCTEAAQRYLQVEEELLQSVFTAMIFVTHHGPIQSPRFLLPLAFRCHSKRGTRSDHPGTLGSGPYLTI